MASILLHGLTKRYGESPIIEVIENLDLEVREGEFVVVLGRSGSGKSTLLSLIAGLERPTSGSVVVDDTVISDFDQNKLAEFRRSRIGFIFQHFHLIDNFTVLENIVLPHIIEHGYDTIEERMADARKLVTSVGLGEEMEKYPAELSGGQKQRVGILRAVMMGQSIILADEPTGDLDSEISSKIIELMTQLGRQSQVTSSKSPPPTIIMATHDINLIREGMRVVVLHDGRFITDRVFDGDRKNLVELMMKL